MRGEVHGLMIPFYETDALWGMSGVAEYEGAIGVQEHDRGVIYHRLMAEIGFICFGIPWFSQPGGRKKIIWRQWEKRTRIY